MDHAYQSGPDCRYLECMAFDGTTLGKDWHDATRHGQDDERWGSPSTLNLSLPFSVAGKEWALEIA